ncbi:uncharacterized protein SCT_3260 [Sulfuricella sp. T08]|uniref:hypothetical protein n=1 Tax=Sulfuricella sp. T08 TaxID=1632857 RepID=UPI00061795F7|nr:hypothetical protein [Sulfuricella sp. T08]GAO37822.1 uncharacterized protein SCT_3260 [Sulfuricella sp. T08]
MPILLRANATHSHDKVVDVIGEKIPAPNKLNRELNPSVAALLQAPALATGAKQLGKESSGYIPNVATKVNN